MYQVITKSEFVKSFKNCGRDDNFSYDGLSALYDYLCSYENETGERVELDPIGLCCEFAEYENLAAFQEDYGTEYQSLEDIQEWTTVIPIDDEAFIVRLF